MIKSEIPKLPIIDRMSSARNINQMIKSIKNYSIEKSKILNFSSDTKIARPISSTKNLLSKISLQLPQKLPLLKKDTQTTAVSFDSDSSGAEIEKYHVALSNRVLQIRGLISKIIDKSPREDFRSHRDMSCKQPRSARYAKSPSGSNKEINNPSPKLIQKKESSTTSTICPSIDGSIRKLPNKKPKLDLVSAANKVSKPLFVSSPQKQLKSFVFEEDIRPWTNHNESEF